MTALHSAKVTAPASDTKPDKELLKELSSALVLMRDKRYDEAGVELTRALESSFAGPETGFVMGEVLRRKEEFQRAAQVYAEVLHQDPDFPQVHTKVSYVLYTDSQIPRTRFMKRSSRWPRIRMMPRPTRMPGWLWATNRSLMLPHPSTGKRCESNPTTPACTTISGSSSTTCTISEKLNRRVQEVHHSRSTPARSYRTSKNFDNSLFDALVSRSRRTTPPLGL